MKILIHSNGPNVPTGYGVQTALLADRLKAAGHDVGISAYFGQPQGMGRWHGMPVYPGGFDPQANDLIHHHAGHFFDGDPKAGWVLPLMDLFGLTNSRLTDFNVAAWCPVDHFPVPPDVLDFFRRTDAVPIAMSRFGEDQLRQAGRDPLYAPLAVDTAAYKPTATINDRPARDVLDIADDQFVVMMNGMNKGWAVHRKGFPHAFQAFAKFARAHPEAVLYMHTEQLGGAGGIDLLALAKFSGIPDHQIRWVDQYAYRLGLPAEVLAACYTSADVFLAPSMGEGFCVPLIEAQACGTPVIVTDFSAQPELVGAGWKVTGQPWWEAAQTAWMISPDIEGVHGALEAAYDSRFDVAQRAAAIDFARQYDADLIFDKFWRPVLAELEGGDPPELPRLPMPAKRAVAVLVPALSRPANVAPLVESFNFANDGSAELYFVCDEGDADQIEAVRAAGAEVLISDRGSTFAQKVNSGFAQTLEPWVFLCGDDVRFHPGWIEYARDLSDRFDIIGTADTIDGTGNPRVAAGIHADHFFVRRSYVDLLGGCLDGPGRVCHEGYRHFYADVETVELAKARRTFTPCHRSVVEHMHPDFGKADVDATYRKGWNERGHDEAVWKKRRPLVAMQRQGLAK